jgi:hypothetical protein
MDKDIKNYIKSDNYFKKITKNMSENFQTDDIKVFVDKFTDDLIKSNGFDTSFILNDEENELYNKLNEVCNSIIKLDNKSIINILKKTYIENNVLLNAIITNIYAQKYRQYNKIKL